MQLVDLEGKRVLVTGGTGFIGGRLVERLVQQCGARVRVLVRRWARATHVARFPVELIAGDVGEPAALAKAVQGCDVVFHCAYGSDGNADKQRRISVGGTENVMAAAQQAGCRRIVHVSTINVYGATADGPLDETAERKYFGDSYSDSKLDAEKAALRWHVEHALPVTVVQPTVVYGPGALAWTIRILNEMRTGRCMLIDGGDGLCNAVYIEDLISGMLLAATRDSAVGECFLLSGSAPTTWREFYGYYERMLGYAATTIVSAQAAKADFATRFGVKRRSVVREAVRLLREERKVRQRVLGSIEAQAVRAAARFVVPKAMRRSLRRRIKGTPPTAAATATATNHEPVERPIHPMGPSAIDYQRQKTAVRIDKAARVLGYQPQFDLATGMQRTQLWAKWAGLLD